MFQINRTGLPPSPKEFLDFTNHEAGVGPQLRWLHGVTKETVLLMPSGVIHVKGNAWTEGWNGEPGNLVLTDL